MYSGEWGPDVVQSGKKLGQIDNVCDRIIKHNGTMKSLPFYDALENMVT